MAEIKRVVINYMSSAGVPWRADIRCYDAPSSGSQVAYLRFFANPSQVPPDDVSGSPPIPVLNYSLDRFADVVGLLRSGAYVTASTNVSYSSAGFEVRDVACVTAIELVATNPASDRRTEEPSLAAPEAKAAT